jgi:hypothetical protein
VGFSQRTIVSIETFPAGKYEITMYAEYAGYRHSNQLRWYKVGTSNFNLIFDGPEGAGNPDPGGLVVPPLTKSFTIVDDFGLSLLSLDGTWYTETSRNVDLVQHARIYQSNTNPNVYLIGFENLDAQSSDFDYNDMVFSLEFIPPPVGGEWVAVNKLQIMAPLVGWVSLAAMITASFVSVKRMKKRQD